jgi:hypothetical protein
MLKPVVAIAAAAIIAAAFTVIAAPAADVAASPLLQPAVNAAPGCKERPWPYLHCVGTEFGNTNVRLIPVTSSTR